MAISRPLYYTYVLALHTTLFFYSNAFLLKYMEANKGHKDLNLKVTNLWLLFWHWTSFCSISMSCVTLLQSSMLESLNPQRAVQQQTSALWFTVDLSFKQNTNQTSPQSLWFLLMVWLLWFSVSESQCLPKCPWVIDVQLWAREQIASVI